MTVTAFCPSNSIKDPQRMPTALLSILNVLNFNGLTPYLLDAQSILPYPKLTLSVGQSVADTFVA